MTAAPVGIGPAGLHPIHLLVAANMAQQVVPIGNSRLPAPADEPSAGDEPAKRQHHMPFLYSDLVERSPIAQEEQLRAEIVHVVGTLTPANRIPALTELIKRAVRAIRLSVDQSGADGAACHWNTCCESAWIVGGPTKTTYNASQVGEFCSACLSTIDTIVASLVFLLSFQGASVRDPTQLYTATAPCIVLESVGSIGVPELAARFIVETLRYRFASRSGASRASKRDDLTVADDMRLWVHSVLLFACISVSSSVLTPSDRMFWIHPRNKFTYVYECRAADKPPSIDTPQIHHQIKRNRGPRGVHAKNGQCPAVPGAARVSGTKRGSGTKSGTSKKKRADVSPSESQPEHQCISVDEVPPCPVLVPSLDFGHSDQLPSVDRDQSTPTDAQSSTLIEESRALSSGSVSIPDMAPSADLDPLAPIDMPPPIGMGAPFPLTSLPAPELPPIFSLSKLAPPFSLNPGNGTVLRSVSRSQLQSMYTDAVLGTGRCVPECSTPRPVVYSNPAGNARDAVLALLDMSTKS